MVLSLKKVAHEDDQPELFGFRSTVHDVVLKKGPRGAVQAADIAALEPDASPLSKALAGRRGRHIADTASSALTREVEGGSSAGYSYSAWCLAGLPHRDLPTAHGFWEIKTDYADLTVRPGGRIIDGVDTYYGVPSGSFARLLLVDLQTEALAQGSRKIFMGKSASALVSRLGIRRGGPVNAKVADQLQRLATCTIDFAFGTGKQGVIVNERLIESHHYVEEPDYRAQHRFIDEVTLSVPFFNELRRHPVLVDKAAMRDLMTSPLAIDIYLWLAYRLHSLNGPVEISWERLWRQFGTRVGRLKNFRPQFEDPLNLALSAYIKADVRPNAKGLTLLPSPPPVGS